MTERNGSDGMQRFHQQDATRRNEDNNALVSRRVDAVLYLSGWAILPFVFLVGGSNGPIVRSPALFAALGACGAYGVLAVKYLPRVEGERRRTERETFRRALESVGADARRWGFLWYVSLACVGAGMVLYWLRL